MVNTLYQADDAVGIVPFLFHYAYATKARKNTLWIECR
ncbi:hypothetical protein PEC301899_08060 [Pectobacterium carotovorum subsp. carotovorum]|nr:hypothetical protein PEC301899_08060 [Pectobacterium carotovorum subsp. carotovorum]